MQPSLAQVDSISLQSVERTIPVDKIEDYLQQDAYVYAEEGAYEANYFSRMWKRFLDWLEDKMGTKGLSVLANIVYYGLCAIGVLLLLYFILNLLGYNKGLFGRKEYTSTALAAEEIDETSSIESIEKLIKEAEASQDYRLAIRLLYLKALRLLDDHNRIEWRTGKTNHEYLKELSGSSIHKEFDELSYIYEYLWYGQFDLDEGIAYADVKTRFGNYYSQI